MNIGEHLNQNPAILALVKCLSDWTNLDFRLIVQTKDGLWKDEYTDEKYGYATFVGDLSGHEYFCFLVSLDDEYVEIRLEEV